MARTYVGDLYLYLSAVARFDNALASVRLESTSIISDPLFGLLRPRHGGERLLRYLDDLSDDSDRPAGCENAQREMSKKRVESEMRNAYDSRRVACCSLGALGDPSSHSETRRRKLICVFPFDGSRRGRMNAHPRLLYVALVALRLCIALTALSTIHPDEHFQNSEIASTIFDYSNTRAGPLRTWEWIGNEPCRSIVPVWSTTGIAFAVLKAVAGNRKGFILALHRVVLRRRCAEPSARALLYTQRVVFWALSLVVGQSMQFLEIGFDFSSLARQISSSQSSVLTPGYPHSSSRPLLSYSPSSFAHSQIRSKQSSSLSRCTAWIVSIVDMRACGMLLY